MCIHRYKLTFLLTEFDRFFYTQIHNYTNCKITRVQHFSGYVDVSGPGKYQVLRKKIAVLAALSPHVTEKVASKKRSGKEAIRSTGNNGKDTCRGRKPLQRRWTGHIFTVQRVSKFITVQLFTVRLSQNLTMLLNID